MVIGGGALLVPTESTQGVAASFQVAGTGSISCSGFNSCLLGGNVLSGTSMKGAVEQEVNGRWLAAEDGIGVNAAALQSAVQEVNCYSADFCVASGESQLSSDRLGVFVQMEIKDRWQRPFIVSVSGKWDDGDGATSGPAAASCPTPTSCVVVGGIDPIAGGHDGFVASYSNSSWHFAVIRLGAPGDQTVLRDISCVSSACWTVGTVYNSLGTDPDGVLFPISLAPIPFT